MGIVLAGTCWLAAAAGCGDENGERDGSRGEARDATTGSADAESAQDGGGAAAPAPVYVVGSVVFNPDGEQTYLNVLDSLEPGELDYSRAVELAGWADLWVHEGRLYVTSREDHTVTRYEVSEAGELEEQETLSFSRYGEVDVAFWSNTFVAPDKAYMIDGVSGYVIWNPLTMEITGTFDLPELPEQGNLLLRSGTLDRSNVIRDGKLYQPMYWSDEDWAVFAPDSRIVVIDIERDEVVDTLEAPCAGLDIGTRDDAGNMYFSTWTGGIFQPLVLGDPGNCVAKIAAGEEHASAAFTFAELTDGREGAAVRSFEDGKLLLSVFHDERVDLIGAEDPWKLIGELNWRTWLYDPSSGAADPVEELQWNSGATYVYRVDDTHYVLVPSTDYAETAVVALDGALRAREAFTMRGWGTRLFKLR